MSNFNLPIRRETVLYVVTLVAILIGANFTRVSGGVLLLMAIIVLALLSFVPWSKQYSLRTLRIATTAIAVVLDSPAASRLW